MKRVLNIIAWTAGAFVATAFVIAVAGALYIFSSARAGDTTSNAPQIIGWLAITLPLIVTLLTLILGCRGRLPGTSRTPPPPSRTP